MPRTTWLVLEPIWLVTATIVHVKQSSKRYHQTFLWSRRESKPNQGDTSIEYLSHIIFLPKFRYRCLHKQTNQWTWYLSQSHLSETKTHVAQPGPQKRPMLAKSFLSSSFILKCFTGSSAGYLSHSEKLVCEMKMTKQVKKNNYGT